jgi:lactate dehydrogenase-like 2-hydroxyacid dehydrogenase
MKKVFITRKIPDNGVAMLRNKGYEVDVSPHGRPLKQDELIDFLKSKQYDAVLSMLSDKIDAKVFDASPSVKIFANYAIGYDNFDITEAKKRGIFLTNTPHGGVDRVAEHAWALVLALTCKILEGDTYMREGKFTGFDPMLLQGMKVRDKVLGLVGAGRIGTEVAKIGAHGFGMRIAYYDVVRNREMEEQHGATFWPTVEEVLKQADIVSLHVPLLDSTKHLINEERLRLMKPTAYLVNTSRGAVVDEIALIEALKLGIIAGAGLDVFEHEPVLSPGLKELRNVVITPHIASSTIEAREDMAIIAAENIVDMLENGKPANDLNNEGRP